MAIPNKRTIEGCGKVSLVLKSLFAFGSAQVSGTRFESQAVVIWREVSAALERMGKAEFEIGKFLPTRRIGAFCSLHFHLLLGNFLPSFTRERTFIPMLPTWQEFFKLLDPDMPKEELRALIADIEGAIFIRSQELGKVTDSTGEFNEMVEAMRTVRRLKIEKMNFPDFNPDFKYQF